jgi:hypothetical protein
VAPWLYRACIRPAGDPTHARTMQMLVLEKLTVLKVQAVVDEMN